MKPTSIYQTHAWWLVVGMGLATVFATGYGTSFLVSQRGLLWLSSALAASARRQVGLSDVPIDPAR